MAAELTGIDNAASEVLLYGKWTYKDVEISDISLEDYIAVQGKYAVYAPHTAGRYARKRFRKAQCPIVERVALMLMHHGRNSGKKLKAMRIMRSALEIIHLLTDTNPIQVKYPRREEVRSQSRGPLNNVG
mmetsp:Transcript_73541/g.143886  ORF Transcript_73541/g.143886 Transcript_73541/m.143886 type:complete len:130 (+) Transcript_73541:48-437(+)